DHDGDARKLGFQQNLARAFRNLPSNRRQQCPIDVDRYQPYRRGHCYESTECGAFGLYPKRGTFTCHHPPWQPRRQNQTGVIIPPTGLRSGSSFSAGRFSPIASAIISTYFRPAPVLKTTTRSAGERNPVAIK